MARKKTVQAELITEIDEIETYNEPDMVSLEKEFSSFIKQVEVSTDSISVNINVDELNEIGDEIIKAKEYLSGFAKGEKKSIREKAYNQFSNLPIIGGWAKEKIHSIQVQALKDSGVKEVLNGIFNSFEVKKKRLIELTDVAENIRNNLVKQEDILQNYINELDNIIAGTKSPSIKMRALDMSIQAQTQDKIVKDQIYNKLNFIIELMEALMIRMSKTLPSLKSQLLNETTIAGMINSISDSVKMMSSLQELTNDIARTSTESIQGLIIDVTNELSNGADIEFYRKSAELNNKFHETLKQSRVKYIENTKNSYDKLKQISGDLSLQLENRLQSEAQALGLEHKVMKA